MKIFIVVVICSAFLLQVQAEKKQKCLRSMGQFEHENCEQFYNCWQGRAWVQDCPEGFVFDGRREVCWYENQVDCGTRKRIREPRVVTIQLDHGCLQPTGQFEHENCEQFYNCYEGKAYVITCPDGLVFDKYTKTCNYVGKVQCGSRKRIAPKPSDSHIPVKGDAASVKCLLDGYHRNPADTKCQSFVDCINGTGKIRSCPEGLKFNPENENCDWPKHVPCRQEHEFHCQTQTGLFAIPTDNQCQKFLYCISGLGRIKSCPLGLRFNPKTSMCDWTGNVLCSNHYPDEGNHSKDNSNL